MKFKIDGALLSNAIKTTKGIVPSRMVSMRVHKGIAHIIAAGEGSAVMLTQSVQVIEKSDNNKFSIGSDNLLSALEKLAEATIEVQESAIIITSKRYHAELLIQPYEKVEVMPDDVKNDKKGIKLKDSFLEALRSTLPKLELKPLLDMEDYQLPFGVKASKEGTFIACFDHFQSAFYFDKELTGNFEFTLPLSLFSTLARSFKGQDYKLALTDTAVYAFNDNFEMSVARPQSEGQQLNLGNMLQLYEQLKSNKVKTKLKIKKEGIVELMSRARAVYEKDSTFTFTVKGDKCQLELKSSYGRIKGMSLLEESPGKDIEFTCDFNFFSSLIAKAPATIELRVNDKLMLFSSKPVTYLLSLV